MTALGSAAYGEPSVGGSMELSGAAVASVVGTSVEVLSSVPELSIVGIEASADGAIWLVRGVAKGSGEVLELSLKVATGGSMAVGTTLVVVASTAGALLVASGVAVAFVPYEVAAAIFYSEALSSGRRS